MSQPSLSMVHVNGPLTNISIAYVQDQNAFIADKVFPAVPVSKQSDLYFIFDKEDFLRDEVGKKAPGAAPDVGGYDIDNSSPYYAHVYAYGHKIPDQVRSNADSPLILDTAAANLVSQKGLIKRESTFMTKYMTTSVWANDITGVASSPTGAQVLQWDNAASTPIEDIRAGMTAVQANTGFRPNTLTLTQAVWDILADHPDIVDRVKYSGGVGNGNPARVTKEAVAAILELDRVLVSSAVSNTAEKGATAAIGFIGGKTALLSYSPPTPTLMMPSAGYTFNWSGFLGSNGTGIRVKKYRLPEEFESDQVEIQMAFDQKVVSTDMGYFFTSIVA